MSNLKFLKKYAYSALITISMMFTGKVSAGVIEKYWETSGPELNIVWMYENFASTNVANKEFDSWTDPAGSVGVKYVSYELINQSAGVPYCYEVETEQVTVVNPDTRIWAQTGLTSFRSASDDIGGIGGYRSRVRIWLSLHQAVMLRIGSYSLPSNNIDFNIRTRKLFSTTDPSACRVVGQPFLQGTAGWPIFIDTN